MLCSVHGPSCCVTGTGNQRLPRRLSAAGLEMNGAFAGLFPSVVFSQTSAIPLEGTSDFQGAAPTRLVMVCGVKEVEGSPVQLHGSQAAPSWVQKRGAGAKVRSGCSSRKSLPVPVGKTHPSICMPSIPDTCVRLHQEVFIVGIGGGELVPRGSLAEQTCLWGSATGRARLSCLCPLRGARGEALRPRPSQWQRGTASQALAAAAAPPRRGAP